MYNNLIPVYGVITRFFIFNLKCILKPKNKVLERLIRTNELTNIYQHIKKYWVFCLSLMKKGFDSP